MKRCLVIISSICLLSLGNILADKNTNPTIKSYCKEFTTNQQQAEAFLKNTIQSAVDNIFDGKFSPRETFEKFSTFPKDQWTYLTEESWVLVIKNIKYNAEIENYLSQDLISDASALLEALSVAFNQSEGLRVLKAGVTVKEPNDALKNKFIEILYTIKSRIVDVTKKYNEFHDQVTDLAESKDYFKTVANVDRETMFLMDLLESNAESIVSLCKSIEVKAWYKEVALENKDRFKKIARAFILRFASEAMLESELNESSFNYLDAASIATKILSGFKTKYNTTIY